MARVRGLWIDGDHELGRESVREKRPQCRIGRNEDGSVREPREFAARVVERWSGADDDRRLSEIRVLETSHVASRDEFRQIVKRAREIAWREAAPRLGVGPRAEKNLLERTRGTNSGGAAVARHVGVDKKDDDRRAERGRHARPMSAPA